MSENDVGCARVGCRSVLIAAMAGALMQSTGAHARNLASWQAEISALALGGAPAATGEPFVAGLLRPLTATTREPAA